jgi:8-oxo-dGTP pyrophosphatase MutT (NUDIX family)
MSIGGGDRPEAGIHPAATVLLLREQRGKLEVLMMRRSESVSFMGGMWVFPGGRLDAADVAPRAMSRVTQPAAAYCAERIGSGASPIRGAERAVGLFVAACRETFEESGALLARHADGKCCDAVRAASLQNRRAEVTREPAAFVPMLEDANLFVEPERFVYWSRWITPSAEKKRFDTHFFATAIEEDHEITADLSELTEHVWITPREALAAAGRAEMNMVPPTLLTLEDLEESVARHGDVITMLAAERERPVPPIMPRIVADADTVRVVMPWDSQYPDIAGDDWKLDLEDIPRHFTNRRSCIAFSKSQRGRTVNKKAPG